MSTAMAVAQWMAWGSCLGVACGYVGSLYFWPNPRGLPRDHPSIIRRRFVSLAGVSAVAWMPLWRALAASPPPVLAAGVAVPSLARALGVHFTFEGALSSVVASLGREVDDENDVSNA